MDKFGTNWRNNHVAGEERRGLVVHYLGYVRVQKPSGRSRTKSRTFYGMTVNHSYHISWILGVEEKIDTVKYRDSCVW